MSRILIIGGTGRIGRAVLAQLPAADVHIRALARNPEEAGLPPHDESLNGIDTVFLVWTAPAAAAAPLWSGS